MATILVVDDEPQVLETTTAIMEVLGHEVKAFQNYQEAIEFSKSYEGTIDLLFTDVVLTESTGYELAKQIQKQRPKMKTMYTSGYPIEHYQEAPVQLTETNYAEKPYSINKLEQKIKKILEAQKD